MRDKNPELIGAYERGRQQVRETQEWIAAHPCPDAFSDPEGAAAWIKRTDAMLRGEIEYTCGKCRDTGWLKQGDGTLFPCECGGWNPVTQLLKFSGIPSNRVKDTFVSFDLGKAPGMKEAYQATVDFADSLVPPWLLLIGSIGCGKTHLAYAAGQKLIGMKFKVRFWMVAELLDAIRSTYNEQTPMTDDLMEIMVYSPDVLILDDLGAERQTDWVNEKLYQILDKRYAEGKPLMVTSNVDMKELQARIKSRFSDSGICRMVLCESPDFRPKKQSKGRARK
jgi:DNA replication protein DnaC